MRRFLLLLRSEFRSSRTALSVHLIAVLQPTLMYLLLATILVTPTFDMDVLQPQTQLGQDLVAAMKEVGSPIGANYIDPIIVTQTNTDFKQIIEIVDINGKPTALQRYGYIDSNLVKNLRNRLTASLLRLWDDQLGSRAITINQHPWLPKDVPYNVYFGMAMIPMAAYLAAALIGGYMLAQEFEHNTILEYRLSPTSPYLLLAAKITRLLLTGLLAALILYMAIGLLNGVWASAILPVFVILIPFILIAASIGLLTGLLTRSSLPAFLVGLVSAFTFWIIGSAFGLASGFSATFEHISRLIPNTAVVEMIFPYFYYGRVVAPNPTTAIIQLIGYCLVFLAVLIVIYRQRVLSKQR